tara:strand:+ start:1608 stop:2405 length:798 start_codon:yes stop_codon:yes gene_type:complete
MKNLLKKIRKDFFLFLSIIIHLLVFAIAIVLSDFEFKYKKPLKYIEITEIIQDENEILNDSNKFATKNNKTDKESAPKNKIDNFEKPQLENKNSKLFKKNEESKDKEKKKNTDDLGDLPQKKNEQVAKESKDSIESQESIFKPKISSKDSLKNEETVDLNTKEFKYISYFIKIKRKIEMVWSYPRESYLKGHSGKVRVLMSLNKSGKLVDIRILNSSGYDLLDNEAKDSIIEAAPYPPFPNSWGSLEKLNIRVAFSYTLGSWGFR